MEALWQDLCYGLRFLGKNTHAESITPDAPVALVSFRYWQRYMGGRPEAMGQNIAIDRAAYAVVGVMPPDFKLAYNFMDVSLPSEIRVPLTANLLRQSHPLEALRYE